MIRNMKKKAALQATLWVLGINIVMAGFAYVLIAYGELGLLAIAFAVLFISWVFICIHSWSAFYETYTITKLDQ